jgi:hypothetical protein
MGFFRALVIFPRGFEGLASSKAVEPYPKTCPATIVFSRKSVQRAVSMMKFFIWLKILPQKVRHAQGTSEAFKLSVYIWPHNTDIHQEFQFPLQIDHNPESGRERQSEK